jgi:hypothetical protein
MKTLEAEKTAAQPKRTPEVEKQLAVLQERINQLEVDREFYRDALARWNEDCERLKRTGETVERVRDSHRYSLSRIESSIGGLRYAAKSLTFPEQVGQPVRIRAQHRIWRRDGQEMNVGYEPPRGTLLDCWNGLFAKVELDGETYFCTVSDVAFAS